MAIPERDGGGASIACQCGIPYVEIHEHKPDPRVNPTRHLPCQALHPPAGRPIRGRRPGWVAGALALWLLVQAAWALPREVDPLQARLPLAWEEAPPEDVRSLPLPEGCRPRAVDLVAGPATRWTCATQQAWRGRSWRLEGAGAEGPALHWLETPPISVRRGTRLSFRMRLATEAPLHVPGGHDGWDGVGVWASVDGGPWQVLEGFRPGYDCASLVAGEVLGLGAGLPGWSGRHEWRKVQKDLGAFAGRRLVLRLVHATDERDPEGGAASVFQVDDFRVQAGRRVLFQDDGDPSSDEGLRPGSGRPEDPWRESAAGGSWSWTARPGRRSELWSRPWTVPADGEGWLGFQLSGPDSVRHPLDVQWSLLARPGDGGAEAVLWTGRLGEGRRSVVVSLAEWAGREIRLGWRARVVQPADTRDGELGELGLSDLAWWMRPRPERDVELEDLLVAWPRREGEPCEVLLRARNRGREAVSALDLRLSLDGRVELDVPGARGLAAGERLEAVSAWVPPAAGEHDLLAWLRDVRDEAQGNDSLRACAVEVAARDQAEFGYSHSPASVCFPVGDPLLRVEEPLLEDMDFLPRRVTVGFVDPERGGRRHGVRLHLCEDDDGSPDRTLWSSTYRLTDPGREFLWEFETDGAPRLQGPFWVWVERLDGSPHVLGAPQAWKPGHAFLRLPDGSRRQVDQGVDSHELLIWVAGDVVERAPEALAETEDPAQMGAVPNPFNPTTQISFQVAAGERYRLAVYNLAGQEVAPVAEGLGSGQPQTHAFDGSRLASGVYFARLESGSGVSTLKLVLSK